MCLNLSEFYSKRIFSIFFYSFSFVFITKEKIIMQNNQRMPSEMVQKINDEIVKRTNEFNINFNDTLISPQLIDLEKNLSTNLEHTSISSSSNYNFFFKDKNGQYKMYDSNKEIEKQPTSSIFKTFNDSQKMAPAAQPHIESNFENISMDSQTKSTVKPKTPRKETSTNRFLSVSIPSKIDNDTIAEGFSVFWTLANQIDKSRSKNTTTKEKQPSQLNQPIENQNNKNKDTVILPAPPINVSNSCFHDNHTLNEENISQTKRRKKIQNKQQESSSLLQKQVSTQLNSKVQLLPHQSNNQSNYPNIESIQKHPQPSNSLMQQQLNIYQNNRNIQLADAMARNTRQLQQIMQLPSPFSNMPINLGSLYQSNSQSHTLQNSTFYRSQLSNQIQPSFVSQQRQNLQKQQQQSKFRLQKQKENSSQDSQSTMFQTTQKINLPITRNQSSPQLKRRNIQPPISQPQILDENQKGCIIEIKRDEKIERELKKDDIHESIIDAREELMKRGIPIIPTSGVYSRPQKAKRHVRRRKQSDDDLFTVFEDTASSQNHIQNSDESIIPIIPINAIRMLKTPE